MARRRDTLKSSVDPKLYMEARYQSLYSRDSLERKRKLGTKLVFMGALLGLIGILSTIMTFVQGIDLYIHGQTVGIGFGLAVFVCPILVGWGLALRRTGRRSELS